MTYLNGKTIVLTGASSGLGRETALRLVRDYKCRVIGVGRDISRLEALSRELESLSDRFSYRVFDVSSRAQWQEFAAWLQESGKKIDVLYNNAGILPKIESFRSAAEDFEKNLKAVFDTDFMSVLFGMDALLPILEQSGRPMIVSTASAAAYMGFPGMAAYSAAKSAQKAFSDCVARELKGRVRIVSVCPGFIDTGLFRGQSGGCISGVALKFCMPAKKAVFRTLRRVNRGRRHITIGADGWMIRIGHGIFGDLATDAVSGLLYRSGFKLYAPAFDGRKKK